MAQLEQQLQEAQAAAEGARSAQQGAEAAAAEQRQQQEADVAALVAHHAEEVASLRRQLTQQQEAAAAARAAVDEAAKEKVAALVRLSEAESGRSKAGSRAEQLAKARGRQATGVGRPVQQWMFCMPATDAGTRTLRRLPRPGGLSSRVATHPCHSAAGSGHAEGAARGCDA